MSRLLPKLVVNLAVSCDAWLVGSAADPDNTEPRDYDVIVPFAKWQLAAALIPSDAKPNTFGGFKCISEGKEVDVWAEELTTFMLYGMAKFAYHHKSGIRVEKK